MLLIDLGIDSFLACLVARPAVIAFGDNEDANRASPIRL